MTLTQKYKRIHELLALLSLVCSFGPLIFFTIKACLTTGLVHNKFGLISSVAVVLILTAVCKLKEYKPRSLIWIALCGLWLVFESMGSIIIWFTATQVLDEFILTPMKKRAYRQYSDQKSIDKRIAYEEKMKNG